MNLFSLILDWILLKYLNYYLKKYPECFQHMCLDIRQHFVYRIARRRLEEHLLRHFNETHAPFKTRHERREWINMMVVELSHRLGYTRGVQ